MIDGLSLCGSFFRRSAALLLQDLVQNNCQRGDRSEERAEDLRNECVLGRQLAEGHEFFHRQNLAFNHAALDLDDVLVFLCEFADHASRSNGIVGGGSHGRRAVENLVELGVAGLIGGEAGQRVLDDRVLDSRSTELIAKLGILRDGDALVVNKYSSGSVLDLVRQSINDGLNRR